jgi:hypothetical protein
MAEWSGSRPLGSRIFAVSGAALKSMSITEDSFRGFSGLPSSFMLL